MSRSPGERAQTAEGRTRESWASQEIRFEQRAQRIRDTYPKRPALLQRLDRAGLTIRPAN